MYIMSKNKSEIEKNREYFINRELSWLDFNMRVLTQGDAPEVPLLEKLRFCAIYTSNLDEFFMVRAGSLLDRTLLSPQPVDDKTGMTAGEQLRELNKKAAKQYPVRDRIYLELRNELAQNGIEEILPENIEKRLDKGEQKELHDFFQKELLPILRPYMLDSGHPFPHLENKQNHLLLTLKKKRKPSGDNDKIVRAVIPVPPEAPKYWRTQRTDENGNIVSMKFVKTSCIIMRYAGEIYTKYAIKSMLLFRVTRNADIEIDSDEAEDSINTADYPKYIKTLLKKREKLSPVRLEYLYSENPENGKVRAFLLKKLSLKKEQEFCTKTSISYSFVSELIRDSAAIIPNGVYKKIPQVKLDFGNSLLRKLEKSDMLLSYPYESMLTYIELLREAVYDPAVESIKITLYRMSQYSEVVSLLRYAAERGKNVVAVVELKARFDEENNIHWAQALEDAGCHVIYGFGRLKVHSKITLITKKEQNSYRHYAHIGTGNYNEQTSRQYTDLGILTSDPKICADAVRLFDGLENGVLHDDYRALLVSPTTLKKTLLKKIKHEQNMAERGDKAYICMKMNSLTDIDIINALVAASNAGVMIDLIIRGICCLKAGVPGATENITVTSIVGRYLEHSRIYYFGIDAKNGIFIGSADMMTRNTSRRIEVLTPIYDEKIAETLVEMTKMQLADNVKAQEMQPDGKYKKRRPASYEERHFDSQIEMYNLYK